MAETGRREEMRNPIFKYWRRRRNEELEEEIRGHLQMAVRDRMERGESREQAEKAARREFGNVGLIKETTRAMWGWAALERLRQDVRYGVRMLRKSPGFSLIVILTLGLGVGANTAIFSVLNVVTLKSLPYLKDPRLVFVE